MYKHPGVYIEDIPSGLLAIEAASTSTAVFVAEMRRGPVAEGAIAEPLLVTSVSQYAAAFGPPSGAATWDLGDDKVDVVGHAVTAFFGNGGTKAYVMRLGNPKSETAKPASVVIGSPNKGDKQRITVTAKGAGSWPNGYAVVLAPIDAAKRDKGLKLSIGKPKPGAANPPASLDEIEVVQSFAPITLKPDDDTFGGKVVNSPFFAVATAADVQDGPANDLASTIGTLAGGADGADTENDYEAAFTKLRDYRDISIIVLPGRTWDKNKTDFDKALTHAEFMKNCMVIIDASEDKPLTNATEFKALALEPSLFAALYHPWLKVPNPYYDGELAPSQPKVPKTFNVAPSGFAAGMWARIDTTRGVWKAPAGLEASVRGTVGPTRLIGNDIQDNINELGVNVIRSVIGPTVIWGARTLATKAKPEFRYISVRRTQSMIGESLYGALQAVVFEPNEHKLWASLRGSVGDFMNLLFKAGAFQGEKASDAYFVRCGLGSTMDQADIDAGVVKVVVGFAPLKPAEFVVVQIQQIVGQRG